MPERPKASGTSPPALPTLPPPTRQVAFGALRHRNFRLFFGGQLVSLTGSWMTQVAQAWLVLVLTDSAFYVGLVAAVGTLPILLLALVGGVVADRTDRRRLVLATQAASTAQSLALFTIVVLDVATVEQIMVLALFQGVFNAFDIPARQSMLIELVGRDDLMSAIALNSGAFNAARVVGPAVAGLVIGQIGIAACFLLDALSYGAVLAALARMRLPRRAPARGGTLGELRTGLAYVRGNSRVLALIALTAAFTLFGFPFLVLMPVLARDVLGQGAEGYGALMAAVGVGAVSAAVALGAGLGRPGGRLLVTAGTSFGILLVALALGRHALLAGTILIGVGFAMVLNNATTNTILQLVAPDELRGRVMSVYTLIFTGLSPFGSLLAGAVADAFGVPVAVAFGGVASATAALAIGLRVRVRGETSSTDRRETPSERQ